jgi:hypothetical protein
VQEGRADYVTCALTKPPTTYYAVEHSSFACVLRCVYYLTEWSLGMGHHPSNKTYEENMRGLISLVFLVVVGYVGWYVYNKLTPAERQKVTEIGKKGLDKAGDVVTKGVQEGLKHIPSSTSAPAPAKP